MNDYWIGFKNSYWIINYTKLYQQFNLKKSIYPYWPNCWVYMGPYTPNSLGNMNTYCPNRWEYTGDKLQVTSKKDSWVTRSLPIQHNLGPDSAFCSLIIPQTKAKTKTSTLQSWLLQHITDCSINISLRHC